MNKPRPFTSPLLYLPPEYDCLEGVLQDCIPYYKHPAATGRLFLFRSKGKTTVTKPLIFMWGFDPGCEKYQHHHIYNLLIGSPSGDQVSDRPAPDRMLDRLLAEGYDCYVVIPDDSTAMLQSNAFLLLRTLQVLYKEMELTVDYSVIGFSAGGVISRWALNWLNGFRDHPDYHVSGIRFPTHYFSYDSPHRGANVPLSLQFLLNMIGSLNILQSLSDDFKEILESINSPAARQLALWHVDTEYQGDNLTHAIRTDPLRETLLAELGDNWSIAWLKYFIANGSGNATGQPTLPGTAILSFWGQFEIRAMPRSDEASQIIKITRLGHPDIQVTVPAGYKPLDSAPGSTGSFYKKLFDAPRKLLLIPEILFTTRPQDTCFVPSTSALDITDDIWDGSTDNAGWNDRAKNGVFHAYRVPHNGANEPHVHVCAHITDFILRGLQLRVSGRYQ